MKTFKVSICLDEGQAGKVKANTPEEAEQKAHQIAEDFGGTDYPEEYGANCVHRTFFTQDVEEVK